MASMQRVAGVLGAAFVLLGSGAAAAEGPLEAAFTALASYDWGSDRGALKPIDDAVVASFKDAAARAALEGRLAAVLKAEASVAAKGFACRKLMLIGSAAAVPALAALLPDEKLSHMGRYALEAMPCREAAAAMREALSKVSGNRRVGIINSLGVRRDVESIAALTALLADADEETAAAAAAALGSIGTPAAAAVLGAFQAKAPKPLKLVAADAYLVCAERLLADGKKDAAIAIYQALSDQEQPRGVRRAALRGLAAARGEKE